MEKERFCPDRDFEAALSVLCVERLANSSTTPDEMQSILRRQAELIPLIRTEELQDEYQADQTAIK